MKLHNYLYKLSAKLLGKNSKNTPKEVIIDQMKEQRALPIGRKEFEDFSERIISGALIPGVDKASQQFVIADTIIKLPTGQSFADDQYFIHRLRRIAVNQTCLDMMKEIKLLQKEKQDLEESSKKALEGLEQIDNKMEKVQELMNERKRLQETSEGMEPKT